MSGRLGASWLSGMCSRGAYAAWEAPVNAQLIDAGTGAHLWVEQMDVDQSTLAIQDNFGIAEPTCKDAQC